MSIFKVILILVASLLLAIKVMLGIKFIAIVMVSIWIESIYSKSKDKAAELSRASAEKVDAGVNELKSKLGSYVEQARSMIHNATAPEKAEKDKNS